MIPQGIEPPDWRMILVGFAIPTRKSLEVTVQPKHLPTPEQWSEIFRNTPANGPQVVGTGTTGAERSLTLNLSGDAIIVQFEA